MPKLFDLVKVNISTSGTGTITFGSAFSNAFLTPSEAGCADGDSVRYILIDGTDVEVGVGVIGGSVTTMTRTVTFSKVSGTKGTSKLTLSGTAYVYFTAIASDLVSVDGANGAFMTDDSISSTSNVLRAVMPGFITGLTLSNNGTDATNDIDIAAGSAADDSGGVLIKLSSGITKRLDAGWFPGSGNGGMETGGSIANGTWHVWLIQRSDTGAVDVLFSASATSPTMPANYDRKRRIGSIIRASGAILAFRQTGDVFKLSPIVTDRSSTSAASDVLLSLTVPNGIRVMPFISVFQQQNTAGDQIQLMGDGDSTSANMAITRTAIANERASNAVGQLVTNTSGQIRYSLLASSGSLSSASISTGGWIDRRGAD